MPFKSHAQRRKFAGKISAEAFGDRNRETGG